jgi:hypothetical protein
MLDVLYTRLASSHLSPLNQKCPPVTCCDNRTPEDGSTTGYRNIVQCYSSTYLKIYLIRFTVRETIYSSLLCLWTSVTGGNCRHSADSLGLHGAAYRGIGAAPSSLTAAYNFEFSTTLCNIASTDSAERDLS